MKTVVTKPGEIIDFETVFTENGRIVWLKAIPTAPGQEALAKNVIAEGLQALQEPVAVLLCDLQEGII